MSGDRHDDERELHAALDRLAGRAPRTFDPPPGMLRRARRRVVAMAVTAMLTVSSIVVGGIALARVVSDRTGRPVPIATTGSTTSLPPPTPSKPGPTTASSPSAGPTSGPGPVACTFEPQQLPQLPTSVRKVAEPNGSFQLSDVDGDSPGDLWLVGSVHGDFGKPTITMGVFLHDEGGATTLLPPVDGIGLGRIDVLGPDDAWATTGVGPLHWDGSSWSTRGHPIVDAGAEDLAISGSGPADVWAVGTRFPAAGRHDSTPFAEHFDGKRWTETPLPSSLHSVGMALWDVATVAPNDAWAVGGDDFDPTSAPPRPVVLHWDGARWSLIDVPVPAGARFVGLSVVAGGPDDVWVAAEGAGTDALTTAGLVLHWDGSSWSSAELPSRTGSVLHVDSLDEHSPNDVWAAGSEFDPQTKRSVPVVEHFDGAGWTAFPLTGRQPDSEGRIVSIRAIGDEVWAVGFSAVHDPPFVSVCR